MKLWKKILIVLLCLIVLPFIIAIFIPRSYTVSVSETINQPRQVVYDYVRILNNQKNYSIWVMEDKDLNPEIVGTDGTLGAIQKWNSKLENVGEGEQEITALTIDRMDVDLRFKRPFEGNAKAGYTFKAVNETQTVITAEFYSNTPYPFNLPSYIFGKKMITEAQTTNLQNLKRILEQAK
ncbi:MAG: SRPBCC family protein [Bacteroidota bacterium]